ncbi:MAG TPA: FAD-dependent oxidoreductase, partial [Clostridia bacterium]|nr:FAD-dependent oxidoreductase [Clostridia bacterium]
METIHFSKEIRVAHRVDVAVIGSGMAGVAAAMAAAEMGRSVLLIERFGVLGGNATVGGVANFCGNTAGQGQAFDRILAALEAFDCIVPPRPDKDGRVFNHELLAVILPELLERSGVRFLLHTEFVDVCVRDGRIDHALISGPSGLEAVEARQFIDCSGDGALGIRAGASYMKGNGQGHQLPMSLMYFVRHVLQEEQVCQVPEGWFERIDSPDQLPMTSIWPDGPHSNAIKIKVPLYDATDTLSMTRAEVNGRRKMMAVLDYHQRVE